jgi:hypothetical protein
MKASGVEEGVRQMVLRNLRDLAGIDEERLRREIEKLGR